MQKLKELFSQYKIYLLHLLIFVGLAYAFVPDVLDGKELKQSDVVQYKGMASEIQDYYEAEGTGPLWTNSQFGGMPSYQISMMGHNNPVRMLMKPAWHHPFNKLFIALVCAYIMFLAFGVSHWLALIGAFAIAFTTNNPIILEAGHVTKMQAIAYAPLIFAGLKLLLKKRYLLGVNILLVGTALELASNHVQITYYIAIIVAIWMISELVFSIKNGQLKSFFTAAGIAAAVAVVGLAINAQNLMLSQEYAKTTIRGKSDLTISKSDLNEGKAKDGLDYDYAYQWSNGWPDIMAIFIPNFAGSGGGVDLGDDSPLEGRLPKQAIENYPFAYWGSLPFTAGPFYMGAAIFMLFVIGFFFSKGYTRYWLLAAFVVSIMLSTGKNHFGWLNDFMFNHVPLYNKFRAPTMALTIAQLAMPMLAILGISRFIKEHQNDNSALKKLKISGGIALGFLFLLTFASGTFTDYSHTAIDPATGIVIKDFDQDIYDQYKIDPNVQIEIRKDLIRSDGTRSLFIAALVFALLFFFAKGKIEKKYVLAGIGLLVVFDLWTVDKRYLNSEDFEKARIVQNTVQPSPVDLEIMKDKSHYRVLDMQANPMTSSRTSNFHKSIGGYHAAKLRRYQELYDWHIQDDVANFKMFESNALNMLNTKYIIGRGQDNNLVYQQNPNALGNAWFVSNVQFAENSDSAILGLRNINPAQSAIVESKYHNSIAYNETSFDSAASISLLSYHPEKMVYESNTSQNSIAIFSEIYYPYGWNAYIDNELTEHFCANYVLRGLSVPKGKHTIEFRFEPATYAKGKMLMLSGNALLYLMLIGSFGFWLYRELKK